MTLVETWSPLEFRIIISFYGHGGCPSLLSYGMILLLCNNQLRTTPKDRKLLKNIGYETLIYLLTLRGWYPDIFFRYPHWRSTFKDIVLLAMKKPNMLASHGSRKRDTTFYESWMHNLSPAVTSTTTVKGTMLENKVRVTHLLCIVCFPILKACFDLWIRCTYFLIHFTVLILMSLLIMCINACNCSMFMDFSNR